jgi:hypothetical protein
MLIVAGLLSHLVQPHNLRRAIETYALRLTTREWYEAEWLARDQEDNIVQKAHLAFAADACGADGGVFREDPWIERIMPLMSPTREEMVRLKLRALRTDAARKEISRRAAGKPTRAEWLAQRTATAEATQRPWLTLGISESTYRRRKKSAKAVSLARATDFETATLSAARLRDFCDFLTLAYVGNDREPARRLAKGPLAGFGLAGIPDDGRVILDHLNEMGNYRTNPRMAELARKIRVLGEAIRAGETTRAFLEYILSDKGFGLLSWAHGQGETGSAYSVKALLDLADVFPIPYEFRNAYEAGKIVVPVAEPEDNERQSGVPLVVGVGAGSRSNMSVAATCYPGREVAGCSRSTWYRRKAAERAAALAKLNVKTAEVNDEDYNDIPF